MGCSPAPRGDLFTAIHFFSFAARPSQRLAAGKAQPDMSRATRLGDDMARKPILPPSPNQARGAPAPDETEVEGLERHHHNARIERNRELKKKRGARKRKVEAAMRSLPLTDKAKSQVSAFVSAFEATYYTPGNGLSAAMRDTAAFAYSKLTGEPIESGSFEQFLREIFRVYEIKADPQHGTGLG
jgi:hypothetical protein